MKKRLLYWLVVCAGLLCFASAARAQVPAWQMAVGTNTYAYVNATATDSSGNVFLAGTYRGTLTLGSSTFTAIGIDEVFVAKWHPSSGFVWAYSANGSGYNEANSLALNGNNIYVGGRFTSPALAFGTTTLAGRYGYEGFVAKLTDTGIAATWAWAQSFSGIGDEDATALAVGGHNVYVTGTFESTLSFGTTMLTNSRFSDIFIAKLTDTGNTATWTWAHAVGGTEHDAVSALAVSDSCLYVSGGFQSPAISFGSTTLTNNSYATGFIAKIIDAGSTAAWTWAYAVGNNYGDGYALAVSDSSVYVAGLFTNPTLSLGTTTMINSGNSDAFVAKLTDAGNAANWKWAHRVGGSYFEGVSSLAVSGSRVYVAGVFNSATISFGSTTLTNVRGPDSFVAKLTDAGRTASWTWALAVGDSLTDNTSSIAVSGNRLYVAGYFTSARLSFSNITLLNVRGLTTGFLAALSDPTLSTEDEVSPPAFTLAPNPAHTTVTFSDATPGSRCTLLDGLGRTVLTATADASGTAVLDVRALPAGLYLVRPEGNAGARRLLVE